MQVEDTVKVSSKGQIVIPKKVREELGIVPGKRLLVAFGKSGILLKKVEELSLEDVSGKLSRATRREGMDVGILVDEAIKWSRRSR